MDISPLYELRARLRAAMLAGTNLLSEDFRLKRAAEAFAPLESASPVFAKIGQMVRKLTQPGQEDKEGLLLDAITLADAVLCTQGAVSVEESVEPVEDALENSGKATIVNAPYSALKPLLDALSSSGSGHYSYVTETHKEHPELFEDYRIKAAMVQALGASYAELADTVAEWLKEEGTQILPLLQSGFDPKGKREMVRRIQVMAAIDTDVVNGETLTNEFYIRMLPEAEKEVRQELIYALRLSPKNAEFLIELTKTEKGNAKKMAYYALAYLEDEKAEAAFREYYQKNPVDVMKYLVYVETKWASEFVAEVLKEQLGYLMSAPDERVKVIIAPAKKDMEYRVGIVLSDERSVLLGAALQALPGKSGSEISEVYSMAANLEDRNLYLGDGRVWAGEVPPLESNRKLKERTLTFDKIMPALLHQALYLHPDKELCELAIKLYEVQDGKKGSRRDYFPAAVTAMLLTREDCCDWLEGQLTQKKLLGDKRNTELYPLLERGLYGLKYDEQRREYVLFFAHAYHKHPSGEPLPQLIHPVKAKIKGRFLDILTDCRDKAIDMLLNWCVDPEDEACCQKLGDYFYKRALESDDSRIYLSSLCHCNYSKCEGLAVSYYKKRSAFYLSEIPSYFRNLPGDAAARYAEAQKLYEIYKKGQLKVHNSSAWGEEQLLAFVEELKNSIQ